VRNGFDPNLGYELVYTTKDVLVLGLGMAAERDKQVGVVLFGSSDPDFFLAHFARANCWSTTSSTVEIRRWRPSRDALRPPQAHSQAGSLAASEGRAAREMSSCSQPSRKTYDE
jgi:hypothetical protein